MMVIGMVPVVVVVVIVLVADGDADGARDPDGHNCGG